MKKRVQVLIFVLFLIPAISAVEITITEDSYFPRETLQAEITGNFVSLNSKNLFIYESEIPRPTPVISGLTKQKDKYYFYAILPNKEGNFSLRIENAQYYSSGELIDQTLIKNFSIKRTNRSALSINPGFVLAKEEFSIKIKSISQNQEINTILGEESETFSLIEETEKIVEFSTSNMPSSTNLKINSYNIPIFIISQTNNTESPLNPDLNFLPSELTGKLIPGEDYFFKILLENSGEENLTNIKLSSDLDLTIKPELIGLLKIKENIVVEITIPTDKKQKENLSGELIAEFNNKTITLPISFEIIEDKEEINLDNTGITLEFNCRDMKGEICLVNEKCTGETAGSLEGPCCIGTCLEEKETDYTWIFGVILIIIVIVIIFFIFKKVKQKRKLKSSKEILKEKTERFDKRMKPGKEVHGNLEKV